MMVKLRPTLPTFGCPVCSQGLIRFVAIDTAGTVYQCDECKAVVSEEEGERPQRTPQNNP